MSGPLLEKEFNQIIKSIEKRASKRIKTFETSPKLNQNIESELVDQIKDEFKLAVEMNPSIEHFKNNYVDKQLPVIIEGQMNHWPATSKWRFYSTAFIHTNQIILKLIKLT